MHHQQNLRNMSMSLLYCRLNPHGIGMRHCPGMNFSHKYRFEAFVYMIQHYKICPVVPLTWDDIDIFNQQSQASFVKQGYLSDVKFTKRC